MPKKKRKMSKPTKTDKFLELLKTRPDGVPSKEAMAVSGLTESGLYSAAYHLRRKFKLDIRNQKGRYFLYVKGQLPVVAESVAVQPIDTTGSNGKTRKPIGSAVLKEVKFLKSDDQDDFFNYLQKSMFYQMTAEALVRSNQAVEEMRKELR